MQGTRVFGTTGRVQSTSPLFQAITGTLVGIRAHLSQLICLLGEDVRGAFLFPATPVLAQIALWGYLSHGGDGQLLGSVLPGDVGLKCGSGSRCLQRGTGKWGRGKKMVVP